MAEFRFARAEDIPALLPLMRDFYEYERLPFDAHRIERLLHELITNEQFGHAILFDKANQLAGYMILTFGYSLEFGGRDALIDEFYVVPDARGGGVGAQAIAYAVELCRARGLTDIHLEADHFNARVHEFYKRLGFRDHPRHLMTLSI